MAPISLTGTTYTQNFDTLASTGTSSILPDGWAFSESGTNANATYIAGTGSGNAGDTYSFGAAGSSDRALGGLQSGSLVPTIGASFSNDTGSTITALDIAFTGEQWRLGTLGRADRIDFQYSLDATSLTTGTWTDVNSLDFTAPTTTGTTGALDGNAAVNSTAIASSIAGLSIPAGATVWLRWNSFDATGADDGLAIDNFSITPTTGTVSTVPIVSIAAQDAIAAEAGQDPGNFRITRTGDTASDLTVSYTLGGTAASNDYTPTLTGTATILAGQSFVDVVIVPVDDADAEAAETVTLTLVDAAEYDLGGASFATVTIVDNDVVAGAIRIHDIQGAAHISPLRGQSVINVPGIVTAIASNGFYLQDPNPDANDATSEGIFVFTSSAPTVLVGDSLLVSGTVTEFRPGNNANNLTTTEIVSPTITKLSSGNALPAAVVIGNGGRAIPTSVIENDATNVETNGVFEPTQDGIDFFESVEGMLVQVNNPVATSPTNSFGEFWVLGDNGANATGLTARGGSLISPTDFNPERIQIDDGLLTAPSPAVNVGDRLSTITGVVDYNFNNYEVLATSLPTVVTPSTLTKEVTPLVASANQLTVGTFNVENLDPSDGATTFANLANRISTNLKSPDILVVEEIQDNNGATNNGVVDASVTYQTLINAIVAAGGPTYQYRQIDPVNNQDGGEPGGNIRQGFLFNPDRVQFSEGSLQRLTDTNLTDGDAFANSRKPLVGKFVFNGQEITVIGNHFNSKGGDQPLYGPNQPPVLNSEVQRNQQATIVANYVQGILAIDANANVIVAGDLNDFEFSNPLNILKGAGLTPLIDTLPANERYTYNFQGNAQSLDHIMASNNLVGKLNGFDVVHINSEFADQDSDHDPSVARFNLATLPDPNAPFRMQILHASDFEGGIPAIDDAVRFSAVLNRLRTDPNLPSSVIPNTLTLSSGDNYIPGAFFNASSDLSLNGIGGLGTSTAPVIGRGDIGILNAFGIQASALGNHEFDLGVRQVRDVIRTGSGNPGTAFPYLSTNLNFQPEITAGNLGLSDLATNQTTAEASTIKGKLAKSTVITLAGNDGIVGNADDQRIGIVGATTPTLANISSTGSIGISPSNPTDYDALAAEIQSSVDILKAQGINKIILLSHMQQFNIERDELAPRLRDVDIILAGGSNTLLSDSNDVLRSGDASDGVYPVVRTGADGNPVLVANTDGNYKYVGRLVTEFDSNGILNVSALDSSINGAYATDEAGVDRVYGTDVNPRDVANPNVVAITDGIRNVIATKDNLIVGKSSVFLNGTRDDVRTQETNFGNLTADANLWLAKQIDPTVVISLKNGGGIRDNIGVVSASSGAVNGDDIVKLPTQPNPLAPNKQTGDISQLDVENSLRFNNGLSLITVTAQQLQWVIEHAVAGTRPGSTPGQFPQVGGLKFSFDPTKTAIAFNSSTGEVTTQGSRVQNLVVLNDDGSIKDVIVRNGVLVGDASRTFRMVTLNFLAGTSNTASLGGDNYPFPKFVRDNAAIANRVDLRGESIDLNGNGVIDPALALAAGQFTFAAAGSEQDAFAEYLGDRFSTNPFNAADVAASLDTRIQNLSFRQDQVLTQVINYEFTNLPNLGTASNGQQISLGGFSGLYFQGLADNGNLKFVTNTDRGPNGDPTGANRPFYLPNFQPEIVSFELNRSTGEITITNRTGLFRPDGTTPLTGLPNLQAGANGTAYTDEIAVDLNGNVLPNDPLGADLEGIAVAANGDYWMVDEYRPAVYHFDVNGKLLDRFIPQGTATAPNPDAPAGSFGTEVLPAVYAQRRSNRGFEAVALEGNKLYAFIQSAIDNPDNAGDTTSRNSRNLRILEFDIASKAVTGEYIYLLDSISASGNARTDKLGDAVSLGNGKFAVVERDDLATSASNKLIYQIDLGAATNIYNASFTFPAGKTTIEQLTPAELASAGINVVSKSLIANAAQYGYTGVEKLEGLALIGPNQLALINDNDFNVSGNSPIEKLGILELSKTLPVSAIDFSGANYSVTEGNGSTTATVRITRTGDLSGTSTVELQLNDGTAKGSTIPPVFAQTKGASSSATPYLVPAAPGVSFTSIITVGDSIGSYKMVGIPDGLGSFDNGDGTFTLLMNHEIGGAVANSLASPLGITRAHGNAGAFVSQWTINKSDLSVVKGEDFLANDVSLFLSNNNPSTGTAHSGFLAGDTTLISRLCSADLAEQSAYLFTAADGTVYGTTARIFQSGEESGGIVNGLASGISGDLGLEGTVHFGRQFAFVATDDPNTSQNDARTAYELPHAGLFSWENNLANPFAQRKTIVAGMDDSTGGQLYFWIGEKQTTGNVIERAGLTRQSDRDNMYVLRVDNLTPDSTGATSELRDVPLSGKFSLQNEGDVSGLTFAGLEALSDSKGGTQLLRPEDGAWDPNHPTDFYFVTTDRYDQVKDGVGTQVGRSRLYRLRFTDIAQPELGGTIEALLDGTEAGNMFDNMTIDRYGHILIQEDVGNQQHLGKIWQYDIATDTLKLVAQHDPARFGDIGIPAVSPFNQDEESSGIIDAQNILGAGWFLLDVQAHYPIPGELVEGGQLLAFFNPDTYAASLLDYDNSPITVTFAPGETFKDVQIPIVGDTNPESNETINLSLKNPSSGTLIGINQPKAVLTILNDDVNNSPVLTGTPAILAAGTEDTTYEIVAAELLAGYTDVNGDVLSVFGLTATNGTLIDNGNGTYSFTPNANFNGTVNLNYNVVDGKGGTVAATQSIAIAAVNDAPVLTAGALTRKISGNISQAISGVSVSDLDVSETPNGPVQVTLTATKGVLALGVTAGITGATTGSDITFSGAIADINAALATLTYKGNPNVYGFGADSIVLTVSDQGNTGSGGALTDSKTIALNIYNTQNGTNGNDIFAATPYPDEILLGGGNDRVLADIFNLQQTDIIDGGAGSDRLVVFGGSASDNLTLNVSDTGVNLLTGLPGLTGTTISNFESFDFSNYLGSLTATGSSQSDEFIGGYGNDFLDGGAGDDKLAGGFGNDLYIVDSIGDIVTELANQGVDTVQSSIDWTLGNNLENLTLIGNAAIGFGNSLDNTIVGNSLQNILFGGDGNDTLDGGLGADKLFGGRGNDNYIVDNIGDSITEESNFGTDTVFSSINWTLGIHLENLTLTGTADLNGTGNNLRNVITGNSGNNVLDGGSNADSLIGKAGDDTYIVDNSNDVVIELAGEGTDTILSSVTRTLDANVENLTLTGNNSINGTGNELDNFIVGNNRNNILDGGAGADTLFGGLGNDTLTGGLGADTLVGGLGNDTLNLGLNDGAIDKVIYNAGDGRDSVNQFVRGLGGDLLQFNGIVSIDVRTVGSDTQFRLGDGVSGNAGFGSGSLLLTLNGVNGFTDGNINDNILAGSIPTSFKFS